MKTAKVILLAVVGLLVLADVSWRVVIVYAISEVHYR
jgi:hypothetical protein